MSASGRRFCRSRCQSCHCHPYQQNQQQQQQH
ncbi:uncharacterized protein Rdh [Drosophila takahashii]|nr:uncharacterized protein LOC123003108 [Drosophila takahashii]